MVLLFNHSDTDFEGMSSSLLQSKPYYIMVNEIKADGPVNPKDRIAQMILERISVPRLQQVEVSLLRSMNLGIKGRC
jgi:dUTPase